MGQSNSQVADPFITLCLVTTKKYYFPGEYVEGEIYLIAQTARPYSQLSLILYGEESVEWEDVRNVGDEDEERSRYAKKEKIYQSGFIVEDFSEGVGPGQYTFPFAMLLPAMITGSFQLSSKNYLKYGLRVQLVHQTGQHGHSYQIFLNIQQLHQISIGPQSTAKKLEIQGCCCENQGSIGVELITYTNSVKNGDFLGIKYIIDNTEGTSLINQVSICLQQKLIRTISPSQSKDQSGELYILETTNPMVEVGSTREIQTMVQIPDISKYTAVGRLIGRYYILMLRVQNGREIWVNLTVNSTHPRIVDNQTIPQPSSWNPVRFPCVKYENMLIFYYDPLPAIKSLNLSTNPNHIKNEPYFKNQASFVPYFNQIKDRKIEEDNEGLKEKLLGERHHW